MWIDPSLLTASFNDSAGTTPVATPGSVADSANPVGLALDIRAGATVLTDPGHHMLQATSAARPLESAYDGQTLGPGNTYDATGYPVFQLYDGIDDSMATASFAAGTLINGMDCMIAVRRDSAAETIAGLYESSAGSKWLGRANNSGDSSDCVMGAGNPTVFVDNVQLPERTMSALYDALTVGEFHILEFRGLDLSVWTVAQFGNFAYGYQFKGARGDIMLYPSTASTADKDAARQYLADKYGVTLA
jgi:hypothetical protein